MHLRHLPLRQPRPARTPIRALQGDVFAASEPGVLRKGHASGTIHYPEGKFGRLIVIKLGLVADDPDDLLSCRFADRGFAHHSTFCTPLRVMWYGTERFEKYRAVGYANAHAASLSCPKPQLAMR
jgi:hypothetical protein